MLQISRSHCCNNLRVKASISSWMVAVVASHLLLDGVEDHRREGGG